MIQIVWQTSISLCIRDAKKATTMHDEVSDAGNVLDGNVASTSRQ